MFLMYLLLTLVPTTILSIYLLRRYSQKLRETCMEFLITVIMKVGTRFYTSRDPIDVNKRYVRIPYTYHSIPYAIYVPFSRTLRHKMVNTKAFLIHHDDTETEISQQPGCCYLITANALGGKAIKIVNYDTDTVAFFEKDAIPVLS